jgi:NAD(P)-dependent dehydrogenase (short-subunit alcohol dehydrogenase family)
MAKKNVIITVQQRDFGRQTAIDAAKRGAKVIAIDINTEELEH